MTDWKKLLNKFLYPPIWVMLILTAISAVALALIFVNGLEENIAAIPAYVIAFYTLSVLCLFFIFEFPAKYRAIKGKIYANKYGNRYMTDVEYRTRVSIYTSLTFNLLYIAINVVSAIVYRTAWFGLLAGYYFILAIIRLMLANYTGKNSMGERLIAEHRRSRTCAVILLTVNLSLTGVVLMMMYQNRGYEYSGILIYVMAAYTFYITVNAIIKLIRYRKYNSPVMMTTKVTSLASALVSMLALETAMLSQFSDAANQIENFDQIMIGATGGGISIVVVGMSVLTIRHANREIKKEKLRRNTHNGK